MLRLTGSALILGAVLWLQRSFHLRTLLRQRTLRTLSGAFLALESAVRLTLTPLPALLRHLSCEPEAAGFFEGVTANLARGEPLASAWEHAAKTLPIAARERETVSALGHALGGDEESVCAALTLAASEPRALKRSCGKGSAKRAASRRHCASEAGQCSVFCCYNVIEKDKRFT